MTTTTALKTLANGAPYKQGTPAPKQLNKSRNGFLGHRMQHSHLKTSLNRQDSHSPTPIECKKGGKNKSNQNRGNNNKRSNNNGQPVPNYQYITEPVIAENQIMDSVVKVYCIHTEPNYSLPWQRTKQFQSTSSGFVVMMSDGTRAILTNAHSVHYHSQVKIRKRGSETKYLAKVLAVGNECDIAMLTVEEEEFWNGVEPVAFGPLPQLQDKVWVVGYPIGGESVSVTSGIVSRIEVTAYAHGATELLGVQIDAAINSGNSGGPVFNEDGECVGIAFQSLSGDAENIGYVIPVPVIEHFVLDVRNSPTATFNGFPILGLQWQAIESPAMRTLYQLKEESKGVLIRNVQPVSHAHGKLLPGDVLVSFDGTQIGCDGTVPFEANGELISFSWLVSQKFPGDTARLGVLRDGQELEVDVQVMPPNSLVPHHLNGKSPSYLIVGGIIFTKLTEPYLLSEYGPDYCREAPVKLLQCLLYEQKQEADQEVVVINQVLASSATTGYDAFFNLRVLKFNGVAVKNLRHLTQMVLDCEEPFFKFDVEYNEVIVLDAAAARDATGEILALHSIPNMVSQDLADLLQPDGEEEHATAVAELAIATSAE